MGISFPKAVSSLAFLTSLVACTDSSTPRDIFEDRLPEAGSVLEDGDIMGGVILREGDVLDVVFWTREEMFGVPYGTAEKAYNFTFPPVVPAPLELLIRYNAEKDLDPMVTVELEEGVLQGTCNGYLVTIEMFPEEAYDTNNIEVLPVDAECLDLSSDTESGE